MHERRTAHLLSGEAGRLGGRTGEQRNASHLAAALRQATSERDVLTAGRSLGGALNHPPEPPLSPVMLAVDSDWRATLARVSLRFKMSITTTMSFKPQNASARGKR